jgi:hypothetical protein
MPHAPRVLSPAFCVGRVRLEEIDHTHSGFRSADTDHRTTGRTALSPFHHLYLHSYIRYSHACGISGTTSQKYHSGEDPRNSVRRLRLRRCA